MRSVAVSMAVAVTVAVTIADASADGGGAEIKLGTNASLGGRRPFPDDNFWNTLVTSAPVDPRSNKYMAAIGLDKPLHPDFGASWQGKPFGIPYVVVAGDTPRVPVTFEYDGESDPDWYPIPRNPATEGGGDNHLLIVDRDNWRLFELLAVGSHGGVWHAAAGAIFDLRSNASRPEGWTSADAAGLPVFPGLVRYDEVVEQKSIRHALRFTVRNTQRAYVFPARHYASNKTDPALPPMGLRVRLKASFDISRFPPQAQVVLTALRDYGMILADNGSDLFVSGAPDSRWNDAQLETLKRVRGRDFEVVLTGRVVTP